MARLRGERAAALRAEQDPLADYAFFDDNAPPYEPDYTSAFEHTTADQDYDEPEWITLVTDQPDEFDVQIQATIERWRQQALFFNWNDLWEEFHGEYMAQKLRTDDWTSSKSYHDFAACKCPAHLKTHRMVDLVDVHSKLYFSSSPLSTHQGVAMLTGPDLCSSENPPGQRRERVAFCDCTRDAVRLLWMGFIPGSPVTPVAAFSMPILILHNCLWNQTHFGALPFTNAMQEYLEPRSERLTTRNGQKARSLRKPFTAAVDLYRQMEDMTNTLMNDVLELSEQQVLAAYTCPSCFGPLPSLPGAHGPFQKYEISVQPPSTRIRLCLSLDGNFQHRHYLKSSRNYDTFRSPRIFLTPEEVDRVDAAIREKELQKKPADKFNNAITCYFETKDALDALLRQANPFSPGNRFAIDFFRRQWEDQRNFQSAHNDAEEDRRQKLVSIFNKEGALQVLRTRLSHVHQHLTSAEDVNDLLDKIETTAADLSRETEAYTRGGQPIPQGQQQKELLLLWSAKSVLFVQMVHLRAEEQPLNDSGSGHHLGTKGKEKVMAATKTRRPMVNKLIKRFNDQFSSFIRNFPDQQVANVADHPLTYNNLKSWPLDHRFWNDGLYHHSTAPWAIDMRVREGINCVLALDRAREEFDLIAEELARALNWAASWYNGQCRLMGYLKARAEQLRLNTGEVAPDHVDDLTVGKCGREEKIRLIAQELGRRLLKHGSMVLEWASDVAWLTSRCELVNNGEHVVTYSLWLNLIQQCLQDRSTRIQDVALDDAEEEAIMQVHVDDGEEIVSMRPGGAEGDNEADEHSDTAEVGDDTAMGDS
ncbi:hypothetical protein KEM48_006613 [Puccinia striiformis f. sp. tritici PST-130]|nr:hypothetical protein KEM48_006613 [Puccinia striiformis f. sp. tritici PST-130]